MNRDYYNGKRDGRNGKDNTPRGSNWLDKWVANWTGDRSSVKREDQRRIDYIRGQSDGRRQTK